MGDMSFLLIYLFIYLINHLFILVWSHGYFLPGESQGRGSLVGCRLWDRTELDTTEMTQQQQQHGYLLHTLGYNPILLHIFYSNCSTSGRWKLFQFTFLLLLHTTIFVIAVLFLGCARSSLPDGTCASLQWGLGVLITGSSDKSFVFFNTSLLSGNLLCLFSAQALESAFSSRSPDSFYWKMVLGTKTWVLGGFNCIFVPHYFLT